MMTVRRISISFIFFLLFILNLAVSPAAEGKFKNKLIILPLQPEKSHEYEGTGLGIHFLLGNAAALHTGLKEFWFGWRLTKIFKGKNHLQAYCKGDERLSDIATLGKEQKIRYWLETCGLPMSKEQATKVVWPEKIKMT